MQVQNSFEITPEETKIIQTALNHLQLLQDTRIAEIPPLYYRLAKESPIIQLNSGLKIRLIGLLCHVALTKGAYELQQALKEVEFLNLYRLIQLSQLSIKPVTFSDWDLAILRLLFRDPLQSRAAIAKKLNLHRSTIAHRLIRLIWTEAIRNFPLIDWGFFGISRLGFRYQCYDYPRITENYLYSRTKKTAFSSRIDILDNWNCPFEEIRQLIARYQTLEAEGQIWNLEMRENKRVESSYNIASFSEKNTSIVKTGLQLLKRLNLEDLEDSNEFFLKKGINYTHSPGYTSIDIEILRELETDFLLERTQKLVAQKIGITPLTLKQRITHWNTEEIVIPMLQIGYWSNFFPSLINLGFTVEKENQVLVENLLPFFARTVLYEIAVGENRVLECYSSICSQLKELLLQHSSINGFCFEFLKLPSNQGLFENYNLKSGAWEPLDLSQITVPTQKREREP